MVVAGFAGNYHEKRIFLGGSATLQTARRRPTARLRILLGGSATLQTARKRPTARLRMFLGGS
jgi:hypothetical protein